MSFVFRCIIHNPAMRTILLCILFVFPYVVYVGQRTIFVLTKVDMAEKSGIKQERVCFH